MQAKILILDDHPIVLEGCRSLLSESFQSIYTAATIADAKIVIEQHKPDVLISDHHLSDGLGLELLHWVKIHAPKLKTLILSMEDDQEVVKSYLDLKADGYLLKNDLDANLTKAVYRVLDGKHFISNEITEQLLNPQKKIQSSTLTPREIEVLKLITDEKSTKEIAELLFISDRTVETHRKSILRKTGCTSLVGLVKYAMRTGI